MRDRLQYHRGPLGELQLSLETGERPILLGSVHIWEEQERVVRFVDEINRLMARCEPPRSPLWTRPVVSNR